MTDEAATAVVDRPTRAEEVQRERRRKPGSTVMSGLNLTVDESKLDRENFVYRHVNDKGARMKQMHDDDWDPAPETAEGGTVSSKVVGSEDGKPYSAVLMRKRKAWYDADQKEKARPLNEMDQAIRRGDTQNTQLRGEGVYTPDGGNKIERA